MTRTPDPVLVEQPVDVLPGTEPRREKRAAGGLVANWVRLVVVAVVGFAQAPILFRSVPAAELGVWYLFFALATFISLSDFGLPSTFGRAVSFVWGRRSASGVEPPSGIPHAYLTASLPELYASALAATVLISLLFVAVALPAALLYFRLTLPTGPVQSTLLVPLLLFLAGVLLQLSAAIPGACLIGAGDMAWDAGTRTATALAGFVLICAIVPTHGNLTTLSAIYVVQGALAFASSHLVLMSRGPAVRPWTPRPRLALVRALYRDSASVFVTRLGSWLTAESMLLIAGAFLGSGRLADLGVLRQLVGVGVNVTVAIPGAVIPHAAAAHAAGDDAKVRNLFLATLRFVGIVNVLWSAGLLLWAPRVLTGLVGGEHFLGYGVLVPMVLASFVETLAGAHGMIAWVAGRWPFARWVVAGGLLNVALGSAGCALFGFPGLAWGSNAAQAPTVWASQIAYAIRAGGIARSYVREFLRPAVAYAAAIAVVGTTIRLVVAFLGPDGGAGGRLAHAAWTLAGVAATTGAAALLAWKLALTPDDRVYFLGLARRRR